MIPGKFCNPPVNSGGLQISPPQTSYLPASPNTLALSRVFIEEKLFLLFISATRECPVCLVLEKKIIALPGFEPGSEDFSNNCCQSPLSLTARLQGCTPQPGFEPRIPYGTSCFGREAETSAIFIARRSRLAHYRVMRLWQTCLPKDSIQKQSFCYATVAKKFHFFGQSYTQNSS